MILDTKFRDLLFGKIHQTRVYLGGVWQLDNGEEKQLVQVVKVKQEKYEGSFNIDDSGTLTFLFDNSYSLLNSKTVKYSLNVMEGGMMGSLNENEK